MLALPLAAVSVVLVLRAPRLPALVAGPSRDAPGSRIGRDGAERTGAGRGLATTEGQGRRPLALPFWLALGLLISGVAAEFCTTFWAPDLLHARDGMTTVAAAQRSAPSWSA